MADLEKLQKGLSEEEVISNRIKYGKNTFDKTGGKNVLHILKDIFNIYGITDKCKASIITKYNNDFYFSTS